MKMLRLSVTLLAFMVIAGILFERLSPIHAAEKEQTSVLLVYDSLAIGSAKEGNVEALLRLLFSMGVRVESLPMDQYESGMMREFQNLITVRNLPDYELASSENYVSDFASYTGNYLHIGYELPGSVKSNLQVQQTTVKMGSARLSIGPIRHADLAMNFNDVPVITDAAGEKLGELTFPGQSQSAPFGVKNERLAYVPYFEAGTATEFAIANMLDAWLSLNAAGQVYVLFEEIYPFSDLKLLETAADRLYEAGIPFIYCVRPVFSNTDYPAMQRYMQVLKYAQSRNGTVLLDEPAVSPAAALQEDSLQPKMYAFIDLLAEQEIVPLGMGDDMFSVSWQELQPLLSEKWITDALPLSVAVTFDFPADYKEADTVLEELLSTWITYSDYKAGSHQTATASHVLESDGGILKVDGQEINLNATMAEVSTDYAYKEKEKESLKWLFTVQNNVYLVVIGIALLLFSGLFAAGARLYRRKFRK